MSATSTMLAHAYAVNFWVLLNDTA